MRSRSGGTALRRTMRGSAAERRAGSSSATTCMSAVTEWRSSRSTSEPCRQVSHRLRRDEPSTSCVACSASTNAASAAATSSPTTSRYVPPTWASTSRSVVEVVTSSVALVATGDVDTDQSALPLAGEAGGATYQPFATRRAGQRDDDALAATRTAPQLCRGALGHPAQRHLAQRGEVGRTERVGQCSIHPTRREDVAVRQAAAQRVG